MKVLLNFPEPLVCYTPPNDLVMSVILAKATCEHPLLLENYIDICYQQNDWVEFRGMNEITSYPGLHFCRLPRDIIDSREIFENAICRLIDAGYYLIFQICINYVHCYRFEKEKQFHEITVFGYDNDARQFFVRDYFSFGKETKEVCSFDELYDAYSSMPYSDWIGGVVGVKTTEEFESRKVPDRQLIITRLKNAIMSASIPQRHYSFYVGFSFFEFVKDIIINSAKGNEPFHMRHFNFIYAHVFLMRNRILYFYNSGAQDYDLLHTKITVEQVHSKVLMMRRKVALANEHIWRQNRRFTHYEEVLDLYTECIEQYFTTMQSFLAFLEGASDKL